MASKDSRDCLIVVLDLDPVAWQEVAGDPTDPLTLESALEAVLVFCNGHLAMRDENEVVVLGATATERCVRPVAGLLAR